MRALRRSLKQDRSDSRAQNPAVPEKSAITIVPPKKVIRALYNYEPQSTQELGFVTGDFFHVIGRENDQDWYEACNPATNARGLVPVSYFQALGRTERDSAGPPPRVAQRPNDNDSGYSEQRLSGGPPGHPPSVIGGGPPNPQRMSKLGKSAAAMVYGIVQFDFNAERPDELEARAGEAIIVIARSTPEWFVAKPIGRLGGPGLIPVSFIQIRDMTTGKAVEDTAAAVERAGVPKVEEWKRMAAEYKNSSIALGKFETGGGQMQQEMERLSMSNHQREPSASQPSHHVQPQRTQEPSQAPNPYSIGRASSDLTPISAAIHRFVYQDEKYFYIISAVMSDGSHWELYRLYEDFYDFQIALLTQFPDEAGQTGRPRVLPFMPGPVWVVTDAISSGRRQNLDDYIKKLLEMPPHIASCDLVKQLFAPRDKDIEVDPDNPPHYPPQDVSRMSESSAQSSGESHHIPSHQSKHSVNGMPNAYQQSSGLSPPPVRTSQQYAQPGPPQGASAYYRNPDELYNPTGTGSPVKQPMQQSHSTSSKPTIKVKIFFQDDLIAIRVPTDVSYAQLREKLRERLGVGENAMVQYKDEASQRYAELRNDQDLDVALDGGNGKLTLAVNYT